MVRGPRITEEAAKQLRILAFESRMEPSQVVSRLIMLAAERDGRVLSAMQSRGLSRDEAIYVVNNNIDQGACCG